MPAERPDRPPDDEVERLIEGALPAGETFSFFRRHKEQPPPPQTGIEPGRVIDDFRLVALIGQGGMGQVWVAEQVSLKRKVALKLVRPDRVNEHTLNLFAREARAGGRLHHAGIVTVYGHGEADGVAWIAMELVEGSWTLRDFLDDAARQELPESYYQSVAHFVAELADAIQAAHAAGVIHRDLKPQNVLVTPDEHPKVGDFGLARITDETALSVTGDFAGTYAYMSPEQVAAKRIGLDHRTDVFSLGVVLYEMLVLQRPFTGDTSQQVGRQIMLEDPTDPRRLRSKVPRDLAVISGKCLEKHPDRRYQAMGELAADIRRHLSNEPILARPPGRLRRLELWARRNPTKSISGAVAVVSFVVVAVLLGANVQANRALGARTEELDAEVESVKRLSALQDYEDLIGKVDRLWPPHSENIEGYGKWIRDAQELVDDLHLHYAKRDDLRAMALPQSPEEREAERRSHADFGRLEKLPDEIQARRAALLQRRDGVATKELELEWGSLPEGATALNALAWPLVGPARRRWPPGPWRERETFGREAEGLVLARRALELAKRAGEDALVATVGDTLSRALFALGRDEEALEASRAALYVAPEEKRKEYEGHLADLEGRVETAWSAEGLRGAEEELARLDAEREELEVRVNERARWDFADTEEGREARWWHANLTKLVQGLEGLEDSETGLLSEAEEAVSTEHGWSVRRRFRFAERLRDGLAEGGEWNVRWKEAIAAIGRHETYGELELARQVGLVPIGPDPESGLWEFWHVATGGEPARDEEGHLVLTEETGLVLVLIPGGTFWMGATADADALHNVDPLAEGDEGPVHEVTLSAYFLSKYEMTQGQWERFTDNNPSYYKSPSTFAPRFLHPLEEVTWIDCMRELKRMGLTLPSAAQWENGCRGGTETPWWTGEERESLRDRNAVNLADQAAARAGAPFQQIKDWPELDDGYAVHAPVGTYAANGFGLHEVHGNVWEWCLDGYDAGFYGRGPKIDPVAWEGAVDHENRGGSFSSTAANSRSTIRYGPTLSGAVPNLGVRPARAITK